MVDCKQNDPYQPFRDKDRLLLAILNTIDKLNDTYDSNYPRVVWHTLKNENLPDTDAGMMVDDAVEDLFETDLIILETPPAGIPQLRQMRLSLRGRQVLAELRDRYGAQ